MIDTERLKVAIPSQEIYEGALGQPARRSGGRSVWYCPFHPDKNTPNFTVYPDGRFYCFACQAQGDVIEFEKKRNGKSFPDTVKVLADKYGPDLSTKQRIVARYPYLDLDGTPLYEVVRMEPKDFSQRRSDGQGGWIWKLDDVKRVPYRLPEFRFATGTLFIAEGEKDADCLADSGLLATTVPCGAGKWRPEFAKYFANRDVVILPDNDETGRAGSEKIAAELHEIAKSVKVVMLPGLSDKEDVSDFLDRNTIEDLQGEVDRAQDWSPPENVPESGSEWPDPQPIKTELLSVEPLPLEILPEPFRLWIEDVSHRMQIPPDFVAMAAITLAGSIIGTRCGIRPKQHDDWLVPPNLWGGAVGRPSMLKTPALKEALRPLARLEAEAKETFDEEIKGHEADLAEHQAIKKNLKQKMEKATDGKGGRPMEDIKAELADLPEPDKPTMHRYKTNDSTIEKLSELLNENPAELLLFRDELVGLMASWEKPGRESDRAFFLEGWDGTGEHTSDRIGRGTLFTKHLCISIFGGIQPSKLTAYLYQSMNGLENDGFIQRLQMLVYPDEVKDWQLVDQAPDREAKERAFRIIQRLAEMDFTEFGAVQDDSEGSPYLRFSDEAQQAFNKWLTQLELKKLRADDHPIVLEHFGKYRSLMPTLALIIHLIDIADGAEAGPISVEAAEKAAAFCEYLESHARRVYGLVLDVSQQAGAILTEKIKKGKLKDGFTVRDVYRQNWHLLNSKELAQSACDDLVDAGWLRPEEIKKVLGRPPLPIYHINPKVKINPESLEDDTDKTD
jgi:DNA primase